MINISNQRGRMLTAGIILVGGILVTGATMHNQIETAMADGQAVHQPLVTPTGQPELNVSRIKLKENDIATVEFEHFDTGNYYISKITYDDVGLYVHPDSEKNSLNIRSIDAKPGQYVANIVMTSMQKGSVRLNLWIEITE